MRMRALLQYIRVKIIRRYKQSPETPATIAFYDKIRQSESAHGLRALVPALLGHRDDMVVLEWTGETLEIWGRINTT